MYEAFYEANSAGYCIEEGIAVVDDNNLLVHFKSVNRNKKYSLRSSTRRNAS